MSAEDERDMEMSASLPSACYALCLPLENADAPSIHHSPPPPLILLYHRGKIEDCEEEAGAASHQEEQQTPVSNRFNI